MDVLPRIIAGSLIAVALLHPTEAAAQEVVERFPIPAQAWQSPTTELGPRPEAYVVASGERTTVGVVTGALTGLAVGAGVGYLLSKDSTGSCDDGICPWVPPTILGGTAGLIAGGWIGYRIAVGPKR